jgi:hypothetical protein
MNPQQIKSERMKFLFISEPNTFATYTCGVPLRTCTIILTGLILAIQSWILYNFVNASSDIANDMTVEIIYQTLMTLIWLVALAGPITNNFDLCYTMTIILEVGTAGEAIIKGSMIYMIFYWLPKEMALLYSSIIFIYLTGWFFAVYIYFSFTKSLGFGLLPDEACQANVNSHSIPLHNISVYTANITNLTVEQAPSIVLTNINDITFANSVQKSIVNQVTLPSGIVVPSGGNGKNWKVEGSRIVLA